MKVSIIVVNYNGMKFLPKCLDSIMAIDYPDYEVIVVDNGSFDGSQPFLDTFSKTSHKVRIIQLSCNLGLAVAQNRGFQASIGTYVLFLNNDTLVDKDILNALTSYIPNFKGVLGCRMGDYDGTRELDSAISVDRFGYPCGTTAHMFYPDGAIFITRSVFEEIGGFDEKLFLFGEDRDLCWRVHLRGYPVLQCMLAVFYHASSCVFGTTYFRRKLAERNMIRSMLKNYSWRSLCLIIPQYVVLTSAELIFLALTGNIKSLFVSYLPAYLWNVVHLQDTLRERRKIQRLRKVPDSVIRKIMSKQIGKLFVLKMFGIPKFSERSVK